MGLLSDRYGRRPLIGIGLALTGIGALCMAIAGSLPLLLLGRILQGVSVAAISSPAVAALAEDVPQQQRALAATLAALGLAGDVILGTLTGGVTAQWADTPQSVGLVGFALGVSLFLPTLVLAREGAPAAIGQPTRRQAVPVAFWHACAAIFVASSVQTTVFTFGGPVLAAAFPSQGHVAAALGLAGFMLASCAVVLLGQSAATKAVVNGLALTALGVVALQLAGPHAGPVPILGAFLICGAGHGLTNVGTIARVNVLAPPASRGFFTSIFNTVRYTGAGAPVLGVGMAADALGLEQAMTAFAFIAAVLCAGLAAAALCVPALCVSTLGSPGQRVAGVAQGTRGRIRRHGRPDQERRFRQLHAGLGNSGAVAGVPAGFSRSGPGLRHRHGRSGAAQGQRAPAGLAASQCGRHPPAHNAHVRLGAAARHSALDGTAEG